MVSNADIELELRRKVPELLREFGVLPRGYQCEVHLHRGNRKKRRTAGFEENWDPDTDSIRISFSPTADEVADSSKTTKPESADRLSDLLRALDRAERRPGYEFISLKWFRDTALAHEGFAWAADELARHNVLGEAIDRRWILTSKVQNPRPPHFPVTAIRLNRQMPEVNAALRTRTGGSPAFGPVRIRGEPLSATVLSDRR
jgi:hypothetical protein